MAHSKIEAFIDTLVIDENQEIDQLVEYALRGLSVADQIRIIAGVINEESLLGLGHETEWFKYKLTPPFRTF